MDWFKEITGFTESDYHATQNALTVEEEYLLSAYSENRYRIGRFELVSLNQLKDILKNDNLPAGRISVSEIVADVQDLHCDPANAHSVFQVASQFNALEMVSPAVSPLDGVTRYDHDYTQGPACAIAAGAATIYRNYLVPVGEQIGQTDDLQLNMLDDLQGHWQTDENALWQIKNGYLLTDDDALAVITDKLKSLSSEDYELLKGLVKVGVQSDTQVTLHNCEHTITQVFCSALPIAYQSIEVEKWEAFARFILQAKYEATLLVAMKNYLKTGNSKLYLTLLGGGAFGNPVDWIIDSLQQALKKYQYLPLDVQIVSYGKPNQVLHNVVKSRLQ